MELTASELGKRMTCLVRKRRRGIQTYDLGQLGFGFSRIIKLLVRKAQVIAIGLIIRSCFHRVFQDRRCDRIASVVVVGPSKGIRSVGEIGEPLTSSLGERQRNGRAAAMFQEEVGEIV